jgi:DNA-binding response OmpR family regulator
MDAHTKLKILCIEDEHFISELYSRALEKAGYDVTVILDGENGLQAALSDTYDIILLDLMVPGITGFEVMDKLQASGKKLKARIVITTNLEQADEDRAKIEEQADGYIIKAEITPHELVAILQNIIPTDAGPTAAGPSL